jgi:hypothetical protein
MIDFIKRILSRYGFGRTERAPDTPYEWASHPFFTEHQRKTERLAAIARERDALKEKLAKAIRDKKARQPIYKALRALSVEELGIESGK